MTWNFKPRRKLKTREQLVIDFLSANSLEIVDEETLLSHQHGLKYALKRVQVAFIVYMQEQARDVQKPCKAMNAFHLEIKRLLK
ncbi:hypothetical protein ACMAZD_09930 [Vibrio sp. nBUS_14]|uniref:hypothetical protein n=1 Tax=Vibrio TaxID=662 RepID=UPI003DA7CDF7